MASYRAMSPNSSWLPDGIELSTTLRTCADTNGSGIGVMSNTA